MPNPTPQAIRKKRLEAGLTQTEAGLLIGKSIRQWIRYESGEQSMDKNHWTVFKIKLEQEKLL